MVATKACASCGATVGDEEVAQGLAVLAAGRLLCPQCVEHLPGESRVMINQMRALRGMASTTYRFASVRHPGLPLFTFTTSALVLSHRRRLVHGEEIVTPPLPPPGSRPRLPTAAEASRGERHGWIVVLAVAAVVIIGLIWLFGGGSAASPVITPPPTTTVSPPSTPVVAPVTQPPRHALHITELENRLRSHPREAGDILRQAELLFDTIPAGEVVLRNRAADLVRAATALQPSVSPVAPKPVPRPVQPDPPVEPAQPLPTPPVAPVQPPPEQPQPVAVVPEPQVVAKPDPKPDPKPVKPRPDFDPSLLPGYKKPDASEAPAEAVTSEAWEPAISWPDRLQPVVTPEAPVPTGNATIPWPWPSGVTIWEAQLDRRDRQRRVAIEFAVPSITGKGGIVLAIDPRRADRTAVAASWYDGTTTSPAIQIPLEATGWQPIAIPLPGPEIALDRSRLRLRIEDAKDLQEVRAMLLCGATLVRGRAPLPEDFAPGLPLIAPTMVAELGSAASREVAFRKAFALILRSLPDRRDLSGAKILLPEVRDDNQQQFRAELRKRLEAYQQQARRNDPAKLMDGNPGDLPVEDRVVLLDAKTAWPPAAMGDLDEYTVAVVGFRRATWPPDGELAGNVLRLLDKLRTAQARPRRPAVLPVFAIGDIEKADPEARAALDARWLPVAQALVVRGYPVIDLRQAMREKHVIDARRMAARLLVDGLRQLDWLARQTR